MTNLKDMLVDFVDDVITKVDAVKEFSLDDDMPEKVEGVKEELIEEFIKNIKERLIGE